MCWIELQENVNIQITDKDIEVYKVVLKANKESCKSCVKGFMYKANTIYKIPSVKIEKTYICKAFGVSNIISVEKAYHSYTKLQYTIEKNDVKNSLYYKCKGIIVGRHLMSIRIDNPYYLATFIIPKGSQYAVNYSGEIISNQIIYTGKYLKL